MLAGAVVAVLVAGIGGALTQLGPWYAALRVPAWKPPDVLFGPAWTLIFALCVIAGSRAWRRLPTARDRRVLLALFAVNAVLNVGWSGLFFHLQRPDWALLEVPLLWGSIVALMLLLARSSRLDALLLLPYLAWVSFAAALNLAIVRLNAPFG